ncbi:Crp/Fnr family transcriptional regulator [Tropicimonas aquimaris]|uniref:Crp/Fnr family transcriptional regulator n=1 Tax=Tropicimonas aquimaris TaxID=914152 RepID=A0ABW3IT28_9RHOB
MKESSLEFDRERAAEVLGTRGWLSERSPAFREQMLETGRLMRFVDGQPLYHVDDEPEGMFGLVSGSVRIEIPGGLEEAIFVHQAEPGFWIGDLALFSKQKRLVGVTARGPIHVYFVPTDRLRAMLRSTPDFIEDFYALTHQNMALALRLLANISVGNAAQRIRLRLLHQDEQVADPGNWIRLSQDELAMLAAVSLPTLQRTLRRLADAGLIELGYGRIRILDREALRADAAP